MFADISRPLPMEGEELDGGGSPIKIMAGLRQIYAGDLLIIEWPVGQSLGTGNWIKVGLQRLDLEELGGKDPGVNRVLRAELHVSPGWHTGAYRTELGDPDEEGLRNLTLVPEVKLCNLPWMWELRTDDVPGWNAFVIGHNCKLHEEQWPASQCGIADKRKVLFNDIRARGVRGSETRE